MDIHYKVYFRNGTEYSDTDIVEDMEFGDYIDLVTSGRSGYDMDTVDHIVFWLDNGLVG